MTTMKGPLAAVFDLDGVITLTARVHAAAWKELFDSYLHTRAEHGGPPFRPFDAAQDYRAFVDGKPRYDGVRSFLESRNLHLPEGSPADGPEHETVCGLGNRKDRLFVEMVHRMGVDVDQAAVRLVRDLRNCGIPCGVASSSRNAVPILERAGLRSLFEAVVDGIVSDELKLKGKPDPAIFLTCLDRLPGGVAPANAMVVEDALSGVAAGRRGHFGLVLGIDRHGMADELIHHGADRVVVDFGEVTVTELAEHFRSARRVA